MTDEIRILVYLLVLIRYNTFTFYTIYQLILFEVFSSIYKINYNIKWNLAC